MSPEHPLVGSWRVTVKIPAADVEASNLATYGADGTVVVAFPSPVPAAPGAGHRLEFFTPALGAWSASGDRGAAMTFVSLAADEQGNPVGTHTVTAEVEVDAAGQSWSGPFRIEVTPATGAAPGVIEGTVAATRIVAAHDVAPGS